MRIIACIFAIISGIIGLLTNTIQDWLGNSFAIYSKANHILSHEAVMTFSAAMIVFGLLSLKFPKSSGIILIVLSTALFIQGHIASSPLAFIGGLFDLFAASPNKDYNTKRSKNLYIIGYIVVFVLVAAANVTVIKLWNKKLDNAEDVKGISISAVEITKEYNADEKAANAKYLNKAIEVSGTISGVSKNQDGGIVVTLDSGDPMAEVQCTLRDSTANPEKGKNVVIKGFCGGNNMGVVLTRCIIK